ncbi:hypothetical protein DMC47_04640 [Nostoc sp. 3335mG]|nr:hypothetical protein DMC47_04640 [Nostoc sp. 3335mG]
MRIAIEHRLSVTPPPGTTMAVLHLLVTPPGGPTQRVINWSVEGPGLGNAGRFVDGFGNAAHLVNQARPEGDIVIAVRGEVETTDTHGVLGRLSGEPVPALYRRFTPQTQIEREFIERYHDWGRSRVDLLHALMAQVGEHIEAEDEGEAPALQRQAQPDGVQVQVQVQGRNDAPAAELPIARPPRPAADYAHLFIGAARALNIPARFVTGYLLGTEDEGGLHAWAEAFDEGLGWIGFDPRMQLCPTDHYVRLAAGLDAITAPPLRLVPVADIVQTAKVSVA